MTFFLLEMDLKQHEREKIREVIQKHFKKDETGSVTCEEVHIVVEDRLQYVVNYTAVEEIFLEEFGSESLTAGNYRYNLNILLRYYNTLDNFRSKTI